jgi:hypothetical protein
VLPSGCRGFASRTAPVGPDAARARALSRQVRHSGDGRWGHDGRWGRGGLREPAHQQLQGRHAVRPALGGHR